MRMLNLGEFGLHALFITCAKIILKPIFCWCDLVYRLLVPPTSKLLAIKFTLVHVNHITHTHTHTLIGRLG